MFIPTAVSHSAQAFGALRFYCWLSLGQIFVDPIFWFLVEVMPNNDNADNDLLQHNTASYMSNSNLVIFSIPSLHSCKKPYSRCSEKQLRMAF